jgi:hypothetical protein
MMAIHRNLPWVVCLAPLLIAGTGSPARGADVSGLAGAWTWSWKDAAGEEHRHVLDIEGIDTKLAARERVDDLPPVRVKDLKLKDKRVSFSVIRGKNRADYLGVWADSDTINGTVTVTTEGQSKEHVWKAKRRPVPK